MSLAPVMKRRRAGEAPATCQIEGCGRPHQCRDMCAKHYANWHYQNRITQDPGLLARYRDRKRDRKNDPIARRIDKITEKRIQLRRDFGITLESYQLLHDSQNGGCAICGGADADKCLAVDHCHSSGKIRGLLCQNCNHAIGQMQDSPSLLRAAAAYLEQTEEAAPRDAAPLGRGAKPGCRGNNARLTPEQVREIRDAPARTTFPFAKSDAVSRIRKGKIYRWVA